MCKVCDHPNRAEIDIAIARGTSNSTIFHRHVGYGDKRSWVQALKDHKRHGHVAAVAVKTVQEDNQTREMDFQDCANEVYDGSLKAAQGALDAKQYYAVGSCLNPAIHILRIVKSVPGGEGDGESKGAIQEALDLMRESKEAKTRGRA